MPREYYSEDIKIKAKLLRIQGYSYSEIQSLLNHPISKATFCWWFKDICLSDKAKSRIAERIEAGGKKGRIKAWRRVRQRAELFQKDIYNRTNLQIKPIDVYAAKLCVTMLYLGEGYKKGRVMRFGNSDPRIIRIFLSTLKIGFPIENNRLRCAIQCRADQNIVELESYWSNETKIPLSQFYKTRIDKRTIGIPTKRPEYKGVLVIYYFSYEVFLELKYIADIIYKHLISGLVAQW